MVPFVLAGAWTIFALVRQILLTDRHRHDAARRSPNIRCYPGGRYEAFLSQTGRLHVRWFQVQLVCEEQATYQQGTDTRTAAAIVHRETVFSERKFDIPPGGGVRDAFHRASSRPTAMHSFAAAHNAVSWMLVVRGRMARWPEFERRFPLYVYPRGRGKAVAADHATPQACGRDSHHERARHADHHAQARFHGRTNTSPASGSAGTSWPKAASPGRCGRPSFRSSGTRPAKGEEDFAVHHFERFVDEPGRPLDLRLPHRFATTLPPSPLSYDGRIVKVCWCVRLRIFPQEGPEAGAGSRVSAWATCRRRDSWKPRRSWKRTRGSSMARFDALTRHAIAESAIRSPRAGRGRVRSRFASRRRKRRAARREAWRQTAGAGEIVGPHGSGKVDAARNTQAPARRRGTQRFVDHAPRRPTPPAPRLASDVARLRLRFPLDDRRRLRTALARSAACWLRWRMPSCGGRPAGHFARSHRSAAIDRTATISPRWSTSWWPRSRRASVAGHGRRRRRWLCLPWQQSPRAALRALRPPRSTPAEARELRPPEPRNKRRRTSKFPHSPRMPAAVAARAAPMLPFRNNRWHERCICSTDCDLSSGYGVEFTCTSCSGEVVPAFGSAGDSVSRLGSRNRSGLSKRQSLPSTYSSPFSGTVAANYCVSHSAWLNQKRWLLSSH